MHDSRIALLSSLLLLAACGGSKDTVPHGSASLTGAASFTVLSGYENAPVSNDTPDLSKIDMVLLDQNWSCGDLQSNATSGAPPHHFLELALDGPQAFTPGTYQVQPVGTTYNGTPLVELATFTDGSTDFGANSGTVTLETISATEMKGSFDVTDGSGATLSGTFDTHFCSVPQAFQG